VAVLVVVLVLVPVLVLVLVPPVLHSQQPLGWLPA
jgi:hypothetical protein